MNLLVVEDNPRDMQELLNLLHGWEEQNQPLGIREESCITAAPCGSRPAIPETAQRPTAA